MCKAERQHSAAHCPQPQGILLTQQFCQEQGHTRHREAGRPNDASAGSRHRYDQGRITISCNGLWLCLLPAEAQMRCRRNQERAGRRRQQVQPMLQSSSQRRSSSPFKSLTGKEPLVYQHLLAKKGGFRPLILMITLKRSSGVRTRSARPAQPQAFGSVLSQTQFRGKAAAWSTQMVGARLRARSAQCLTSLHPNPAGYRQRGLEVLLSPVRWVCLAPQLPPPWRSCWWRSRCRQGSPGTWQPACGDHTLWRPAESSLQAEVAELIMQSNPLAAGHSPVRVFRHMQTAVTSGASERMAALWYSMALVLGYTLLH